AMNFPSHSDPAQPNTVTSCPSRTSSRVSSQTSDSTLPPVSRRTGADRVETWAMRMSIRCFLQEPWQYLVGGKDFFRQPPGREAVSFITGVDAFDARNGFVGIRERHDAFANCKPVA